MTRWLAATMIMLATSCETMEVEREIGYKGRARSNPWLAAERFLTAMGRDVRSVVTWTAPQDGDIAWMLPASLLNNESFCARMEEWVMNGGHLVLLVEYADGQWNDWSRVAPPPVLEKPLLRLLERHGVRLRPGAKGGKESEAQMIPFQGRTYRVAARTLSEVVLRDDALEDAERDDEGWLDEETAEEDGATSEGDEGAEQATGPAGFRDVSEAAGGVFASVPAGWGRISVVTDGRMFRNRWIDEDDHAALLDAMVVATRRYGRIGLMRGSEMSFWGLLRQHLWPVLLAGGVWLALWLWKNFARFGPVEAAADVPVARGYGYHLEALGDFQWRLDRGASMVARLHQQVREGGQRLILRAGRGDGELLQVLADRSGLPRERVERAMSATRPSDMAALVRITADLQQLLKVLHTHP